MMHQFLLPTLFLHLKYTQSLLELVFSQSRIISTSFIIAYRKPYELVMFLLLISS